ncbi:SLC13 family permease [Chryseosolibacter indicus]|uniref:Anion permease n=1 Tax=Chryseosolibacter indicus TaxID=2782351 RepID=A0ABS5VTX1_9BACT|nr:anion permease [Chryseosolibacter indicus]
MDLTFAQVYVLVVVAFLVIALYREVFNPALTFFISTVGLLLGGIITPAETLKGLSNIQIIIIFLLVLVTAGIRLIFGTDLFIKLFNPRLSAKAFLLRMMVTVSSMSAFLNNTPIVAFMIPYVKDWAQKTGNPASKFLIPLSFATILGGMITVIGTSTNLVLNGLIGEYKLPLLQFKDFFFLGIVVTVVGWVYLYFIGYKLLPANTNEIDILRENVKEYIVETEIADDSKLIGKSVKDAGLRNLQDVFLVEIIRNERIISPVSPDEILEAGDNLFFSGDTQSIYKLIKEDNGLSLSKEHQNIEEQFNFADAVVPANSELIGRRIKDSNFRQRFNASIIAVHRDGKRVSGKVGETQLAGGDFLLLLSGNQKQNGFEKDLFLLSVPKPIKEEQSAVIKYLGLGSFILLALGIVEVFPLFNVCLVILSAFVFLKVMNLAEIRKELDLSLLMILVCSLAVGVALEKSGTADLIADVLIRSVEKLGAVAVLASLFIVTILLTSLITNAAAVSIVFPIAMSMAEQLHLSYTPFFVAIAYAASGDFMTPIGYQTNLMIYGPGGYSFKDFIRVGTPLTILYISICIGFIAYYYNLI